MNRKYYVHNQAKRAKVVATAQTNFILKPLNTKKRVRARDLLPQQLLEFRQKSVHRNNIQRQDARTLLQQREKAAAAKFTP